jgi:hypothetical protein
MGGSSHFKAMEASFFRQEKVLQYPDCHNLMDDIEPAEFVAEETSVTKKCQLMRELARTTRQSKR